MLKTLLFCSTSIVLKTLPCRAVVLEVLYSSIQLCLYDAHFREMGFSPRKRFDM